MEQPSSLVTPPQMESAADGPSLQRADSVQMWGGAASIRRAVRTALHRYLDVVLGAVLLLAGALKGQQMLTDPSAGLASGFPREVLIGAAAFELAFGCWLLAGLFRRATRWLALAWFTCLAAVALAQAMGGASSCACFGELQVGPNFMFLFDAAAVATLWMWSPNNCACQCHLLVALCLSLLPAMALLALAGSPRDQIIFAEIDLGHIAQGGQKQHGFQVRNNSGAAIQVAVIETSCPCASARLERSDIPAGQFLAGNVTLDLRLKPDFVGDLAIEARGFTRRGRLAFTLVIRARVHPASQADKK